MTTEQTEETVACCDQMAIAENYERIIAYLYPIAQSMPRKHGMARDMFLQCLMGVPDLFIQAGKSNQVGKLYAADAGLAHLRFWMRFLHGQKCISHHQLETAQGLVSDVGGMVNAWIKRRKKQGQAGT